MVLIKCKECTKEISNKAIQCPECGIKIKQKTSLLTWIVFFGVIYGVYSWAAGPPLTPEEKAIRAEQRTLLAEMSADFREGEKIREEQDKAENQEARDEEMRQFVWMENGKDAVKARMKDPDSVEFRNVYFHRGATDTPVTCGEVNGRNSFGGFNGYQYFVSAGSPDNTFLENEVADFSNLWESLCIN